MSRKVAFAALAAVLFILEGCQTSRRITLRSELADPVLTGPITVYSKDRGLYVLSSYTVAESSIVGSGTSKRAGKKESFKGEIPFASILAIEAPSSEAVRNVLACGIATLGIAAIANDMNGAGRGLAAEPDVRYHSPSGGGGSSCPYVFAWDGERYVLEAEPFGVGLGKALELTTVHLLPSARAENGIVRLRLTNERRETHYVNSIRLLAIETGRTGGAVAVLDGEGVAWPVVDPRPASAASDGSGREILPSLASVDGAVWESDAPSISSASGYVDVLDLTFTRPPRSIAGSLILTGINTTLSTSMFGYLCRIAGDQALALTHAIDTDREMIALLRTYLDDASLKVSVWNGGEWEAQGAYRPEANAVTFTRSLRIHVPESAGGTVRVRLRSLADVWRIDAIQADWTEASPLPMRQVDLLSAIGPAGEDLRASLAANDGSYAILLPPDRVEMRFAAATAAPGNRVFYAVAGGGYLHEWVPQETGEAVASISAMLPGERRIEFLKEMLKRRDLVLQTVYEEWARLEAGKATVHD